MQQLFHTIFAKLSHSFHIHILRYLPSGNLTNPPPAGVKRGTKMSVYVVRCHGSISKNWTTHFYDSLEAALSYIKATKYTKYCEDDTIYLTREALNNCCLWSGNNAPEVWRFKD